MKFWKIGAIILGVIGAIWGIRYITTPPPGTKMPDQGREHVSQEQIADYSYNSNPPTSGPHDPDWIRPGVYAEPQNKGKLIHSLEHGYVVIYYKTPSKQLEDVARDKKLKKLILVPQPDLDATIALTAWTYIDKLNDFDAARIGKFIDYHRDQGPEKTME